MKVVGITMVKDEADIIDWTIQHMMTQLDAIVVLDNGSTDATRDILERFPTLFDLHVIDDPDPGYYQSRKMSGLAQFARRFYDADWIVPFDADEAWYAPTTSIREHLAQMPDEIAIVEADLYDHVATALDPDDANPLKRIGWRRYKKLELPKVACRAVQHVTIEQGNHGAHYAAQRAGGLVVRHFPYRSAEQFVRKVRNGAAAYASTDLPESAGAHWRQYGRILETFGEEAVADIFRHWFWSAEPTADETLIFDPAPL